MDAILERMEELLACFCNDNGYDDGTSDDDALANNDGHPDEEDNGGYNNTG